MGKRPYYIINIIRDYDGYDSILEYIGTNYKAALNRYARLIEYIKQEEFFDQGVREGDMEIRIGMPENPLQPGEAVFSTVYDNDCCYYTIELFCRNTDVFNNQLHEEKYKREYPDAKH